MTEVVFWLVMVGIWFLFMTEGLPAIKSWWVTYRFRKSLDRRDDFPADKS